MMDESSLVEGLGRGDLSAFRELVEGYKKKVYYLAFDMTGNHHDAEDISQEVFLKIFRSFGTYRKGSRFGAWLYRVAYNAVIDHLRKKALRPDAVEDAVLEGAAAGWGAPGTTGTPPEGPEASAEQRLLQVEVRRALQKVSPQERAVFLLRHENDLKLADIADALGLSIGSVKSYLFRAVRKLRKELGGYRSGAGIEVSS